MIDDFLRGAIAMGMSVAGLFFLRFWKESRDRLFAFFALAFLLLASNRLLLVVLQEQRESTLAAYAVRLLAFLIIIGAIVDKNVSRPNSRP